MISKLDELKIEGTHRETIFNFTDFGRIGHKGFKIFLKLYDDVIDSKGGIYMPAKYVMRNVFKELNPVR